MFTLGKRSFIKVPLKKLSKKVIPVPSFLETLRMKLSDTGLENLVRDNSEQTENSHLVEKPLLNYSKGSICSIYVQYINPN